jgi:hypothetical protein
VTFSPDLPRWIMICRNFTPYFMKGKETRGQALNVDNVLFSPFIASPDSAPVGFPRLHIGGQASHDSSWAGFIGIVD